MYNSVNFAFRLQNCVICHRKRILSHLLLGLKRFAAIHVFTFHIFSLLYVLFQSCTTCLVFIVLITFKCLMSGVYNPDNFQILM